MTIPRISEQAREARRPLPVSTLLSARQETIHRDPGAARAARSVKVSDPLPPEVLKLLGDDATPERAAGFFESVTVDPKSERFDFRSAHTLYRCQLAAAAIRECEARRAHAEATTCCSEVALTAFPDEMRKLADKRDAAYKAWRAADEAFDALRNWRKT